MTDRQRNTLAFVLCGLVLLVYMIYQQSQQPLRPAETQPAATQPGRGPATRTRAATGPTATQPATRPAPPTAPARPPTLTEPAEHRFRPAGLDPQDNIVLGSSDPANPAGFRIEVTLTNRGAAVTRIALADFRNVDEKSPLVLFGLDAQRAIYGEDESLVPATWPLPDQRLFLLNDYREDEPQKTFNLEDVTFKVVEKTDRRVIFETTVLTKDGETFTEDLLIRKTFELEPGSYTLEMWLEITNLTSQAREFSYQLQSASCVPREEVRIGRQSPPREVEVVLIPRDNRGAFRVDDEYAQQIKDPEEGQAPWGGLRQGERLAAAGMTNKYFAVILMPAEEADQRRIHFARAARAGDAVYHAELHYAKLKEKRKQGDPDAKLSPRELDDLDTPARISGSVWLVTRPDEAVEPGEQSRWRHHYLVYAGPKDPKVLANYQNWGLPHLFTYGLGSLNFISKGLGFLLHLFHGVPPHNYGLAIILLTIVVRGVMHPLSRKQARGMRNLQKLKPQLDELKKRYKGDRQGLGRAQMELYKQHGYNPMSGCLPMLLQMPIFICLWRALSVDPALRQAGLVPPITDLSRPDVLLPLGFGIPLILTEITHLRLLPILSMSSMFLSQRLTPKPPSSDQQAASQKKMMVFMFVFFALLLYNVASGLLLYITVSSLIGILEQWHIRKSVEKTEGTAPANTTEKKRFRLAWGLPRVKGAAADKDNKAQPARSRKSAAKGRRRR